MVEIVGTSNEGQAIAASLDRLTALVEGSGAVPVVPREARGGARTRALELFEIYGPRDGAAAAALLGFAADLLGAIAVDLAANPSETDRLLDRIEAALAVPRSALAREVLRTMQPPALPIDVAIEVQLSLLMIFTRAQSVSLWTLWPNGELKHVSYAGDIERGGGPTRRAAQMLINDEQPDFGNDAAAIGIRIGRLEQPAGALIARGADPRADERALLLEAAAPVLAALLDRDALSAPDSPSEQTVMRSVEGRLARLRFDLHDGPQQGVYLLGQDVRLFREQLRPLVAGKPDADRLLGRLDDLEAQLVALDGDLRRLSSSVQSPFLPLRSLPEALRQMTDAFAGRTGVQPETLLSGDLGQLTDSEQITLLALIGEALANIREHTEARTVTITISAGRSGVEAKVTDDGCGFEPEATLVSAARAGRLGLVGMHERVRMLGGRTRIDSQPGGPTAISATLPSRPRQEA